MCMCTLHAHMNHKMHIAHVKLKYMCLVCVYVPTPQSLTLQPTQRGPPSGHLASSAVYVRTHVYCEPRPGPRPRSRSGRGPVYNKSKRAG